jgi:dienelactone hydrolase
MRQAGVDWQLNIYGGAVHSFTNPGAGNDPSKGTAYNAKADRRSWEAMELFFREIFQ